MKYIEAKKFINDNWDKMEERIREAMPSSDLLGTFVAPEHTMGDADLLQYFFTEVVKKGKCNESAILNLQMPDFSSDKLKPFVVINMRGNPIALSLQTYLDNGFSGTIAEGKAL